MAEGTPDSVPPPVLGAELISGEEPFAGVHRVTHQTAHASIATYAFEPGASFPPHSHPEEQITVVLEGEVEFVVAGRPWQLAAGETIAVPASAEHSLRAGEAGARVVGIILPRRESPNAYDLAEP